MEKEEKVKIPYIYDTPTGIVEKEGMMLRGMGDNKTKPLWVRLLSVFFSLVIFVIPGLSLTIFIYGSLIAILMEGKFVMSDAVSGIIPAILGPIFLVGGLIVIYKNIKKRKA
jgi:hypothetical protein